MIFMMKIFLPKNWRCFVQNTVTFVQNLNENIIVFKTNTIFFQKLPKIVIITLTPGSNQTVAAFYIQLGIVVSKGFFKVGKTISF
jgi:hypothetical protein